MKLIYLASALVLLSFTSPVSPARAQGLGSVIQSASPSPEASVAEEAAPAQLSATPAAPAATSAPAAAAKPPVVAKADTVQKIAGWGIEFTVPKNWQVTEIPGPVGGTGYQMLSKDGAMFALIPSTKDDVASRLATMRSAQEKAAKKVKIGDERNGTMNGMKFVARTDIMEDDAETEITGYIEAEKPVVFLRGGVTGVMKANAAALDGIFRSIKKSE